VCPSNVHLRVAFPVINGTRGGSPEAEDGSPGSVDQEAGGRGGGVEQVPTQHKELAVYRPLIGLACAAVALTVLPAQASPFAGQYDFLSTGGVTITGADGAKWVLTVGATEDDGVQARPEQALTIDLRRCAVNSCTLRGSWSKPLGDAEVDIHAALTTESSDLSSTGHVLTTLAGRRLEVSLTADSISGTRFEFVPGGVDYRPHLTNFSYATGTVRFGSLTCALTENAGQIGQFTGADTIGDDARTPRGPVPAVLPAGFLTGKRTAHC
jgi:hypothetical protein